MSRPLRFALVTSAFLISLCAAANSSVSVQPATFNFGKQYLNKEYLSVTINITDTGTGSAYLQSFAITGPFQWRAGLAPQRIAPGATTTLAVRFWPTAPGPASGNLVLNFKYGLPSITIPLSGIGVTTTAGISYSTPEVVFSNQTVGSAASQSLTLTNPDGNCFRQPGTCDSSQFLDNGTELSLYSRARNVGYTYGQLRSGCAGDAARLHQFHFR